MSDWYNDPPESNELPECCGEYMVFNEESCVCKCEICGKEIAPEKDIEPVEFD